MPESLLTGGTLGGLIAFRSDALDVAQNALGRIALTLATNFNDQHHLGMDLTGALGGDYFAMGSTGPTVKSGVSNAVPGQQPSVTISNVGALTTSDYRLSYNGGTYTLQRLSDNTTQSFATLPQTVDGLTFDAGSWVPVSGDSFLIQPTRGASASLALAITDPRAIAAAAPIRTVTPLTNTGTGSIDPGTVIDTTNAAFTTSLGALTPPILIRFDSTSTYTLYDNTNPSAPVALEGPLAYSAGSDVFPTPGALDYGYRIKISGAPAAGDAFNVEWNSSGFSDNRNGVALGGLQTKDTMEGGTATYLSVYSAVVAQIGTKAHEAEITGQAQQSLLSQAQNARDQLSGVNLDEEAANLLRYQQAYQAAAKTMDIAGKLFDELLALGR